MNQRTMICLDTLPIDILQAIIKRFPERPIKTELLLINKTFCSLFMAEQVSSLTLSANQVKYWITLTKDDDNKKPCSVLQYRNLLNQIYELVIYPHEELFAKEVAGFVGRCTNLRRLALEKLLSPSLQWDIGPFFDDLPSNIIVLRFSRIPIGNDDRIRSLVKFVSLSTRLKKLYLIDNDIDKEGVCSLAEGLKQNSTLNHLLLWHNSASDKGAYALAECLKNNSTLTRLTLRHSSIGAEGACALAKCLKQNSTLTHLNLWGNNIGDEGAYTLAEYLKQNSTLTNLNLKNCSIGDKGARALLECQKQNSTLTELIYETWPIIKAYHWSGIILGILSAMLDGILLYNYGIHQNYTALGIPRFCLEILS